MAHPLAHGVDKLAEALHESGKYSKVRDLGKGTFGCVILAKLKDGNEYAAIKFLKRSEVNKYVEAEIVNHSMLRHPHVVQFKEVRTQRRKSPPSQHLPYTFMHTHTETHNLTIKRAMKLTYNHPCIHGRVLVRWCHHQESVGSQPPSTSRTTASLHVCVRARVHVVLAHACHSIRRLLI